MKNCECNTFNCTVLSVMASIIIGITTAILRYTAILTIGTTFLWVAFGIAVAFLLVGFLKSSNKNSLQESDTSLILTIIGALLTILVSVVLLGFTFAATSALGAIISGVLLGGFSLLLTSAACYIKNNDFCC